MARFTPSQAKRVVFSITLLLMSSSAMAAPNLYEMLSTLAESLGQVWEMLTGACWLFGIMIFLSGMLKLKKYGQMTVFMMSHAEIVGPLSRILIGTLLIYTQYGLNVMLATLFNEEGGSGEFSMDSITSYNSSMTGSNALLFPVFLIVQIIGLLAFMRGLMKLTKAGEQGAQPGTVPTALMLVFGGVMCVNIVGTINMVRITIGLPALVT